MQTPSSLSRMASAALVGGLLVGALSVSGCAANSQSPTVYQSGEAQSERTVRYGRLESVRQVEIAQDSRGIGGIAGAVVGGVAGSGVGEGRGSTIMGVLGALAGAAAGDAIERGSGTRLAYELIVKLDSGGTIAVVQEAVDSLRPGDRVILVGSGTGVRVSRR